MKRLVVFSLAIFALIGCQSGESTSPEATSTPEVVQIIVPVGKPSNPEATKIALVVQKDTPVTVGYSADAAFRAFRDPKEYGNEYNDLPPNFQVPYRARSWEAGQTGFGEITYDGNLVAAMYREDKVLQDRVDDVVKAHQDQMETPPTVKVSGKKVTYWFWEMNNQRLMICAFQSPSKNKGLELTIAMGDDVVLDALGISPTKAQADQIQVDSALRGASPQAVPDTATSPQVPPKS